MISSVRKESTMFLNFFWQYIVLLLPECPEDDNLRFVGRRRHPVLLGILYGIHALLRPQRRSLLRTVCPYDCHGQRFQERRRDDWEVDPDPEQDPSSRHHQRTYWNHIWCNGFGINTPEIVWWSFLLTLVYICLWLKIWILVLTWGYCNEWDYKTNVGGIKSYPLLCNIKQKTSPTNVFMSTRKIKNIYWVFITLLPKWNAMQ